jgi:hypothetical protein
MTYMINRRSFTAMVTVIATILSLMTSFLVISSGKAKAFDSFNDFFKDKDVLKYVQPEPPIQNNGVNFSRTASAIHSFNDFFKDKGIVVQQEPPIQDSGVKILRSTISSQLGTLTEVGELQNNLNHTIQNVGIVYTFYDFQNKVVAAASTAPSTNVKINVLRPGEKTPFSITFTDPFQIFKSEKVKVSISWQKAPVTLPAYLSVRLGDNYTGQVGGQYHLVGEVTNQGDGNATLVRIAGAFYNDKKQVVAIADTSTMPPTLAPHQTAPFDLALPPPANANITSVSINAQSQEYSMINKKVWSNTHFIGQVLDQTTKDYS